MSNLLAEFNSIITPNSLISEYYFQSEAIIQKAKAADRLLTLVETKKLKELSKAIQSLDSTIDSGATMGIFMELTDYINQTDHELALKVIDMQRGYLKEKFNLPHT